MAVAAEPTRLASPELRHLIGRRLAGLVGFVLFGLALLIAAALASYDPLDPSLNTANVRPLHNILGYFGATLADLLLQGFGAIGALPVVALLAWAWSLVVSGQIGRGGMLLRISLLLSTLPVAAAAISGVATTLGLGLAWPTQAGIGGAIGSGIAATVMASGRVSFGPFGATVMLALLCVLSVLLGLMALGLSRRDWQAASAAAKAPAQATNDGFGRARTFSNQMPYNRQSSSDAPAGSDRRARYSEITDDDDAHPTQAVTPSATRVSAPAVAAPFDTSTAPALLATGRPTAVSALIARSGRKSKAEVEQPKLALEPGWRFPPLSLLTAAPLRDGIGAPAEEALVANDRLLESVLADYGVQGKIVKHRPGPVVTLYELEPAPGIRSARVIGLADDVARSLSVTAVRIATVSGRNVIGIEVPNSRRETVFLSELLSAREWQDDKGKLSIALGKTIGGDPVIADLARMPHLLVAGTTGSGKSVGINAMILSLLYRLSPEQCRLILIDPKMLELSVYEGIPHLMAPVVTDPKKAVIALKWTVREMERRYRSMSQLSVRNIGGYNDRVAEARSKGEVVMRRVQTGFDSETGKPTFEDLPLALEPLPFIVVIIDEMADLMMVAGKEIEAAVQRLAQMARAAGIHVVMATQRPSVDVITGTIKANFPTRISFQVISKFDSRTILGEQGSEQLLGMGDMLYMAGGGRIQRVHGPFVEDDEVEKIVAFLREQGEPAYIEEVTEATEADEEPASISSASDSEKGLFDHAVDIVAREGKASTSFLQRHLQIGYNRAAKLIEQMEKEGIVSASNHVGKREVLVRRRGEHDDI